MAKTSYTSTEFSPSSLSRNLAFGGLVFTYIVGVAFICAGIAITVKPRVEYQMTSAAREVIALFISFVVFICNESVGFIHSTALKWDLLNENRLEFNSNLRFIQHSSKSWPNGIIFNFIYAIAFALSYSAAPVFFASYFKINSELFSMSYDEATSSGDADTVTTLQVFSASAAYLLGVSFLIQAIISTVCLRISKIGTWNASALATARVACTLGHISRQEGRCMVSVSGSRKSGARNSEYAFPKQLPFLRTRGQTKLTFCVIVLVLMGLVSGTIGMFARCGMDYVQWTFIAPAPTYMSYYNKGILTVAFRIYDDNDDDILSESDAFVAIWVVTCTQLVIAMGIHCAELHVLSYRDEMIWRQLASKKGSSPNYSVLFGTVKYWPALILSLYKPIFHWLYGMAMYVDYQYGLLLNPPQFLTVSIFWLFLVVFIAIVSSLKFKGPLPATYGHLQTIANIIDVWEPRMYWGHKSVEELWDSGSDIYDDDMDKITIYDSEASFDEAKSQYTEHKSPDKIGHAGTSHIFNLVDVISFDYPYK
ncbi:uncharacterized protein V1518DRAFT_414364 [Limtongia smithiae]|uniref:uncharacterized protein n=1 Tax=Limtongia smithiae TaxID=1125753 RepID=UPI0034CE1088